MKLPSVLLLFAALVAPAFGLLPQPTSMTLDGGSLPYTSGTRIFYETRGVSRTIENSLLPVAEVLAEELEITTGIKPAIIQQSSGNLPGAGDISLEFDAIAGTFAESEDKEDQSYTLVVTDRVVIRSQYFKGVSYGTSTLIQSIVESSGSYSIPKMTIEDVPASDYRGLMVDVARDPSDIGTLKEVVRLARQYKIRYLHVHFTDDQHFTFPFAQVTDNLPGDNFTYSRSDLQDLNAYADAHGVTIVPELEMPGHSGRLRASGYMSPGTGATESDVASSANYAKLQAIIDDMLSVFTNTPYFHIGGDESSAGEALVPLVEAMNNHLRGKPAGQKKRLMVWEAFHGAPTTQIPPTGDDRVIVLAWELNYNTPWNLLNNGYELINCSWKPMYVVGAGATHRMAHSQQLMWSPEEIFAWDKNTFSHFLPGMPVFEDVGPSDPVIGDGIWSATYIGKEDQVIGGQLISWEQNDKVLIRDLQDRLPPAADRLWNPNPSETFATYSNRYQAVKEKTLAIVQPIEILPASETPNAPYSADYRYYSGNRVQVTLRNRTKIPGTIRYNLGSFNNSRADTDFAAIPETTGSSAAYSAPFNSPNGGFGIRARLHRSSGAPLEGHGIAHYNNWANLIKVTEFEVPRHPLPAAPDFASYVSSRITRSYSQPIFRGPYVTDATKGQMFRATLDAPGSGTYTMRVETGGGFATLYIDRNRNGIWEASERVFANFNGSATDFSVTLDSSPYQFRVDHATNGLSSLLMLSMDGPGTGGRKDIATYLTPPVETSTSPAVPALLTPTENAGGVSSEATFSWSSDRADEYQLFVWPKGGLKPVSPTVPDLDVSSHRLTGLLPGVEYRWCVVASNGDGQTESEVREFRTFDPSTITSIGWSFDNGIAGNDTLTASAVAGVPPYAQANWNNHSGVGQGAGSVPRSLVDNSGNPTSAQVTAWSVSSLASWFYGYAGSDPDGILMNVFNGREPSITFSNIPEDYQQAGYLVVVYYGNNEGPSDSLLTIDGSLDDFMTRNIRTGNTAQAAQHLVGYIEAEDGFMGVSNCAVFTGLNDPSVTVSLTGTNNNGISAVQIVRSGPPPVMLEPGPVTTYHPFYPDDWTTGGHSTDYYPWTGEEITFMTMTDDLDHATMTEFVGILDGGWKLYRDLTGRSPTIGQRVNGNPVIAAIPYDAPTCGIGCGFLGHEGIETTGFYTVHYPQLLADPAAVAHLYFYEMGRNYYTFGDKHENFITGFAVFMRYVCIDTLGVTETEVAERTKIDGAIDEYVASGTHSFLETFTNGYGLTEKMQRIPGCDQPVMYASAMLKLWKLLGDEWLADFYRQLMTCPGGSVSSEEGARSNALSWFAAASRAAEQDLSPIFVTQWRMILTPEEQAVLAGVNWTSPTTDAGDIVLAMLYAAKPKAVSPNDGATEIHPREALKWDFNEGATYDVYLWADGGSKPGTPTASGLTAKFYEPAPLSNGATYHWSVVAHHAMGSTESDSFTFTTMAAPVVHSSIGWNYDGGFAGNDSLSAGETAGIARFAQSNWNNHAGIGQDVGAVPFSLNDSTGAPTGTQVTTWSVSLPNSWFQGYSGNKSNGKMMNAFSGVQPTLTFSGIPLDYRENGYVVVVYYGNNEGPADSVLSLTGSVNDVRTRSIRTGSTALSAYHHVGFVEATNVFTGPSNYTIFTGLNDPGFTLALANENNNGICAVQIVKMPVPPTSGFIGWNYDSGYTPATYDTVAAAEEAGAPGFKQKNWNNHTGSGQAEGTVPFSLKDSNGVATSTEVTAWSLSAGHGWQQDYSGTDPDSKLMNSFTTKNPWITFAGVPSDFRDEGYTVVVYYTNNEGPSNSVLTVIGSEDDLETRTVRTGNTSTSAHHVVGYLEGTDTVSTPTNYTVFRDLNDAGFTVALANANNNGICAIQIVRGDGSEFENEPLSGFSAWQESTPGAGVSFDSDNDKDGLVDFAEYALGSDPGSGLAPAGVPRIDSSGGSVDFVYRRPAGLTDVAYVLEGSIDCEHWFAITDVSPTVTVEGGWEEVRYNDVRKTEDVPGMMSSKSVFFRMSFK